MRTFFIHPFIAAIVFSMLLVGAIGAFALIPIVCINWTWNVIVASHSALPMIGLWQAGLLYLASACILYLLGIVQIEFKAEMRD